MKEWTGYHKGINLGGWLSQCENSADRYENFIHEEDLKIIKSWGMDHVRVPVDYELIEDEAGNILTERYKYIDRAIEWAQKNGLNMILDLHKTAGYVFDDENYVGFFSSEELQERFYKLWERFAERYGKYENMLAFELLNEVTDPAFGPVWNEIADKCIKRIRKIAPTIKILVGGYWNNSVDAVKDLAMPQDENIIYNFHCYSPLIFTHQGAGWIKEMPADFRMSIDNTYAKYEELRRTVFSPDDNEFAGYDPEAKFGPEFFEKKFIGAIKIAEERNVSLYCGEYGVIDYVDPEETLKWYTAINEVLEKYNIGRAAWSYRQMNFGISDSYMDGVRERLIKVM